MFEKSIDNDVAKEILIVLAYCDSSFVNNIPSNILNELMSLASTSSKEFYINKEKTLAEQNISDECKKFIRTMYAKYMNNSITNNNYSAIKSNLI